MSRETFETVGVRKTLAYDAETGEVLHVHTVMVEMQDGRALCEPTAEAADCAEIRQTAASAFAGRKIETLTTVDAAEIEDQEAVRVSLETRTIEPAEAPSRFNGAFGG